MTHPTRSYQVGVISPSRKKKTVLGELHHQSYFLFLLLILSALFVKGPHCCSVAGPLSVRLGWPSLKAYPKPDRSCDTKSGQMIR